jgi:hypothetical protein
MEKEMRWYLDVLPSAVQRENLRRWEGKDEEGIGSIF